MKVSARRLFSFYCLLLSLDVAAEVLADDTVMVLFEAEITESALSEIRELMARMVTFNEPDEPDTVVYRTFTSETANGLRLWRPNPIRRRCFSMTYSLRNTLPMTCSG